MEDQDRGTAKEGHPLKKSAEKSAEAAGGQSGEHPAGKPAKAADSQNGEKSAEKSSETACRQSGRHPAAKSADLSGMHTGRRVALCGILTALAMIFSYVEAMLPINFGVPGMKLGIANLVVVTGLYFMRPADVFLVSLVRILLMGWMFGNGMSVLYSLAGGVLSFLVMLLLKRFSRLSMTGVSIAGGVCHNLGQVIVASLVVNNIKVMYYFPALMAAGVVTGMLIGILSGILLQALRPVLPGKP